MIPCRWTKVIDSRCRVGSLNPYRHPPDMWSRRTNRKLNVSDELNITLHIPLMRALEVCLQEETNDRENIINQSSFDTWPPYGIQTKRRQTIPPLVCPHGQGSKARVCRLSFSYCSHGEKAKERLLKAVTDYVSIEYFTKYYISLQLVIKLIFNTMKRKITFWPLMFILIYLGLLT